MACVMRWILFLAMTTFLLTGCWSAPDKQWYKPGGNYTVAEFDRDKKTCTKNNEMDDQCMKDLGWVTLSSDQDKGPPPMKGGPQIENRPRTAPK